MLISVFIVFLWFDERPMKQHYNMPAMTVMRPGVVFRIDMFTHFFTLPHLL